MTETQEKEQKRQEAAQRLGELIADIPVAMLTTCTADHKLHSRPMVNVNAKLQGELWFFTQFDDPKVEEIRGNPQVNVAFSAPDKDRYVSVTGTGTTIQDPKRCELLWTSDCERWFPDGPSDDHLALIKIEIDQAEYWDAQRHAMVVIAGFFKSLAGKEGDPDVKHEQLDWQDDAPPTPPQ